VGEATWREFSGGGIGFMMKCDEKMRVCVGRRELLGAGEEKRGGGGKRDKRGHGRVSGC